MSTGHDAIMSYSDFPKFKTGFIDRPGRHNDDPVMTISIPGGAVGKKGRIECTTKGTEYGCSLAVVNPESKPGKYGPAIKNIERHEFIGNVDSIDINVPHHFPFTIKEPASPGPLMKTTTSGIVIDPAGKPMKCEIATERGSTRKQMACTMQ